MAIKIKYRDPKITDFKPEDIILNITNGTLFYKSKSKIFKIQGDDISTAVTELSSLGRDVIIEGNLVPVTSGSQDLGTAQNPWRDLHILEDSIKFYSKGGGESGKVQFERGKGLKVRDEDNNLAITSASVFFATDGFETKNGITGSIDCGLF